MPDTTTNLPLACRLAQRGLLRLGGADRRAFLQGLISNDIQLCQGTQPLYAALLTPQGKFLHDLFITDCGEDFLVDCEASRADDLLQRLMAHKLRSKITLENVSEAYDVWAMWGTGLSETAGFYPDPRLPALGQRGILRKGEQPPNSQLTDFAAYDYHRLQYGVPDGSRDMILEKSTLLEGNLDRLNAISWTKGCYMGQELTARTHYRGLIKKRLFPVVIEGVAPSAGSILSYENEESGEMRSHSGTLGLALLSIEKAEAARQTRTPFVAQDSRLFIYEFTP